MKRRIVLAWALGIGLGACGPAKAPPTYCDVDALVGAHCTSCHSSDPQFGAPMPLMHAADFEKPAVLSHGEKVWQAVERRLHDAAQPMPPTGELDAKDLAALDAWLGSGRAAGKCPDTPLATRFTTPGTDLLPCAPDVYVTASRAGADAASHTTDGFPVPVVDDEYMCFGLRLPAKAGRIVTALAPLIGESRVVHHMILYHDPEATLPEGPHDCGLRSGLAMPLMLWAPGAGGMVLPGDVGLWLGDGDIQFDLEVHYNNSRRLEDVTDASGFAMCTQTAPRKYKAAVGTLGTIDFTIPAATAKGPGTLTLTNECDSPELTEPTRILAAAPHMHAIGAALKTTIIRGADDREETLVDVPKWNFNDQHPYAVDVVLEPHDRLRTTCTWSNPKDHPVRFGPYTDDEMCFDFLLYYPAGQISIPGLPAQACLDPEEILSHQNP